MQEEKLHQYICIDLKSFYASVECVERGLNPLTTNLVVADVSRTQKTICLAVSPSMKQYGIKGRPRLFEVIQRVQEINIDRAKKNHYRLKKESISSIELENHPDYSFGYIAATPQMAKYIEYSTRIYQIYLKYIAPEDVHVYSIDEVFMDATNYLKNYHLTAKELAMKIIQDVLKETGITATSGIGTNLYLAKVAMDIVAKHIPADENGVRIAELDEMSYRRLLWNHTPLTDFWRVGRGIQKRLEAYHLYTMGDIARASIAASSEKVNEDTLYKEFGINAELLIDHAWGYEPCTMEDIKKYKPMGSSMGTGQVLHSPYPYQKAKLIVKEMAESLSLDLVEKGYVTDQIILSISYDATGIGTQDLDQEDITTDYYGRSIPKGCHGSIPLGRFTSSTRAIMEATIELYDSIIQKNLLVRRINIAANHVLLEEFAPKKSICEDVSLFTDYEEVEKKETQIQKDLEKEKKSQKAILEIKKKFGKNSIIKGMDLEEGATTKDRNEQIGGHKA